MISTSILTPPAWTEEAVCASVDPAIFYPPKGVVSPDAKKVCAICPVIEKCLAWALEYESGQVDGTEYTDVHGIYGGLTPNERRAILRHRAEALKEAS